MGEETADKEGEGMKRLKFRVWIKDIKEMLDVFKEAG